jgi:PAS domain-containing protein
MTPIQQPSDLTEGLAALRDRIDELSTEQAEVDPDVLLAELEAAHEELRVADEEVRAQQSELEHVLRAHQTGRAAHERLIAVLPAAVVVTDAYGVVQTVNAAAAALLRMRVGRLIHKPVFVFVEPSERADLRQRLAQAVETRSSFRTTTLLQPRSSDPLQVEVAVTAAHDDALARTEVTWVLLTAHTADLDTDADPLLARCLAELATLPVHAGDRSTVLGQVAHACQRAFPMRAFVSISIGPPAEPELVATDSRIAQRVDGAQIIAGEGPCQSAWETGEPVTSTDLTRDERWPRLVKAMQDEPPTPVIALPVLVGDEKLGVVNIYGDDPGLTAGRWVRYGELLAATIAAVLREIDAKAELEALAHDLRRAMESRAPIEQAKGILMASRHCTADEAFAILTRMSNKTNVKVRDLAVRIVADAARDLRV